MAACFAARTLATSFVAFSIFALYLPVTLSSSFSCSPSSSSLVLPLVSFHSAVPPMR